MEQKSVLIIGSKGMLGQELVRVFDADENYSVTAWDREDIDVTNAAELVEKVTDLWPDIIFNAVAYNAVDACEEDDTEYEKAKKLNADYPGELAKIAKNLQATLTHYSTDYVFDGQRPIHNDPEKPGCCGSGCDGCQYDGPEETIDYYAYGEDDKPNPLSRYGKTKYGGELAVAKNTNEYYIIRLSKLFGKPATSAAGKKAFFDVMLAKGREAEKSGDVIKAVDGEMSKFTYAPDLAQESKKIIEDHESSGTYHVVNDGPCTWYDGVVELYKIAGIKAEVEPVTPETFPRPAKRPASSVLLPKYRTPLRHYTTALTEYLSDET